MHVSLAQAARRILAGRKLHQIEPAPFVPERRTCPDAVMDLMLRFETERGPRTLVAPGVSLALASEIADAMIQAGHYAEMVDHTPAFTVAQHVARRKLPPPQPAARDTVLMLMRKLA
jgi:hypothetical protein